MLHRTHVPDRAHDQMHRIGAHIYRARARRSLCFGITTCNWSTRSTLSESTGLANSNQCAFLCRQLHLFLRAYA